MVKSSASTISVSNIQGMDKTYKTYEFWFNAKPFNYNINNIAGNNHGLITNNITNEFTFIAETITRFDK